MYRSQQLAVRSQVEQLRRASSRAERRAAMEERRRRKAEAELAQIREGVLEAKGALDGAASFRWSRAVLWCLGLVGLAAALPLIAAVLVSTFDTPLVSLRGLRNAAFHLRHGDGLWGALGAAAVVLVVSPWVLMPWLGSVGLQRRRRWGWILSVVASLLWLPTPLLPASVCTLVALFSERTRDVFFAGSRRVAEHQMRAQERAG